MRGEFWARLENVDRTDVGQRENAPRRFGGLGHLAHVGMRHLTAHESDVLDAGHVDVRDEHAASVEVSSILLAQQAGADPAYDLLVIAHMFGDPVGYVYAFTLLYARNRCQ